MKLNTSASLVPGRVIQQFGEARLVRHPDGTHVVIGGTAADLAAVNEWISLFAHEIVCGRPSRERPANCRTGRKSRTASSRW